MDDIRNLIDIAYDTGYYSGKPEHSSIAEVRIAERNALLQKVEMNLESIRLIVRNAETELSGDKSRKWIVRDLQAVQSYLNGQSESINSIKAKG